MTIPDWFEKINVLAYFTIVSAILIAISIIYDNDKWMPLWLGSFIYGILGFAVNARFPKKNKRTIELILFLSYVLGFVLVSIVIASPVINLKWV